jgi:hypothetical protein
MLDGQLWNMVYSPMFTIPHLDPGSHVNMVSLSSNDHMDYLLAGEPIRATATVEVAERTGLPTSPLRSNMRTERSR